MNELMETIEAYYEDYVERLQEHPDINTNPLSKEEYINRICSQLEQSVYDEMKYLLEDHP